jgi:WD40 repeat protein
MVRLPVSHSTVNGGTAAEDDGRLARLMNSVEPTSSDSRKAMLAEAAGPTAFISYSRIDMEFVDRLEVALKARGVDARVDREHIEKGEVWWTRIRQLITEADTVIFVLSPDSAISPTCQQEVDFAEGLKKRLIPIVVRDLAGEPAPVALARLNYIFFVTNPAAGASGDFDQTIDELVRALEINIEWIREHTRLGLLAHRWDAHGRLHEMELRGEELSRAETWLTTRPKNAPDPTDTHRAYVTEGRRAATARQRRTIAMLVSVVIGAVSLSGLAIWQWRAANWQSVQAEAHLREAQIGQSRFLADQARQKAGDAGTAALLALEALPDREAGVDRPYVPEAELQLDGAWRDLRERLVLRDVLNASFTPDGQRIVTASRDNTARIWAAATGKPIGASVAGKEAHLLGGSVGGQKVDVSLAAFSPDGTRIATASMPAMRIWDAASGKLVSELRYDYDDALMSAAFSPDGKRIVTASTEQPVLIWDVSTGRPIGDPPQGHVGPVLSVAFSPDGQRIVAATRDNTARIWDAATGKPIGEPLKGPIREPLNGLKDEMWSAAFSADGTSIATASDDAARIWDAASRKPIGEPLKGHEGPVWSVAFSRDGKRIVTASLDRTARIWNAENGKPFGEPLKGHEDALRRAAFSPDGRRIVTVSSDNTARIWDVESSKSLGKLLNGHLAIVSTAAFSPDGRRIVVTDLNDINTARILDVATGRPIGEPLKGHEGQVWSAAFSHDGQRIVTASRDNTARIWDAASGKPIGQPLKGHYVNTEMDVISAAFSPDGTRILTAPRDAHEAVRIWDAASGKPVRELLVNDANTVWSAAFSRDGTRIVAASESTVQIWDAASGKPIGKLLRPHWETGEFLSAAFSPDGTRIVTSSRGGTAQIWDVASSKVIIELKGHRGQVWSAAFSPDGRRIVTASDDNTARIWDAASGKPIGIRSHEGSVDAAFSPDGNRLVTSSRDGTARIWDVFPDTQALVSHAKAEIPRCLTATQRRAFFLPTQPPAWCIEMEKWPYDTSEWKQWLADKRVGKNPALPAAP